MSEFLSQLSKDLSETVAAAGSSIVRVEGRARLPASGIAWSQDGVVVTAHHVVERDENIKVGLAEGESVAAKLVGRDPSTDIAVLRAETSALKPPSWVEPGDLSVGNLALAAGRPGRTVQATLGIVSALGDGWRTPSGGQVDRYLQADVAMYPGFSGGPLVDASGGFIGLNSSGLLRGFNVALPAPTLNRVVETLLTHGRVRRGYLGVGFHVVRLPSGLSLDQETGLLVTSVEEGSAAEGGGILMGDTIVALDGQTVGGPDDLLALLGGDAVGKEAPVKIVRSGQVQQLAVTVGERP